MPVGRSARREARRERVEAVFGPTLTNQALDFLELVELAWHDCYGTSSPSEKVIDQILLVSRGNLGELIEAGRLAVIDSRDLQLAADAMAKSE